MCWHRKLLLLRLFSIQLSLVTMLPTQRALRSNRFIECTAQDTIEICFLLRQMRAQKFTSKICIEMKWWFHCLLQEQKRMTVCCCCQQRIQRSQKDVGMRLMLCTKKHIIQPHCNRARREKEREQKNTFDKETHTKKRRANKQATTHLWTCRK